MYISILLYVDFTYIYVIYIHVIHTYIYIHVIYIIYCQLDTQNKVYHVNPENINSRLEQQPGRPMWMTLYSVVDKDSPLIIEL